VLDGVSERMPSLALAQKLLGKAAQVRVAMPKQGPPAETGGDDPRLSPDALSRHGDPRTEAELGDALLALVAAARSNGWDAERALRERLRGLDAEIRTAEQA